MRTFRVSDDVVIVPEMVAGVRVDESFGPVWRVSVILPMGGEAVVAQFASPVGENSGYVDERGMVRYRECDQAAALALAIVRAIDPPNVPMDGDIVAVVDSPERLVEVQAERIGDVVIVAGGTTREATYVLVEPDPTKPRSWWKRW